MGVERKTLGEYLAAYRNSSVAEDLAALVEDVAGACRNIASCAAGGALGDVLGAAGSDNVQGEAQQKLDTLASNIFLRANEKQGHLAGMVSDDMEVPFAIPAQYLKGRYLLIFDPLDGSSNVDVNASIGSIFSILRAPAAEIDALSAGFLQPGSRQACAGYAIYGPSTMLVLTFGDGVYGFTLEPGFGEFVLTHPKITMPRAASEFAIDASDSRFWEPPVRRYVDECLSGEAGPRHKDFSMRWVGSLVAEAHRILMRGGVFLCPRDTKEPKKAGRLRLLHEANPIALIIEQAGGGASTGRERILDMMPDGFHQRVPVIFGGREEVELIEKYHHEQGDAERDAPLFGSRGLFRVLA